MDEEGDGLDVEEEVLHNAMICPSCSEFEGHDILASKPKEAATTTGYVAKDAATSTPSICARPRRWSSRSC